MSRIVHLARHGETVWHAENRYAGRSDVALTARGREQAAALADWAAGRWLEAVWSSDLARASGTAAGAAAAAGVLHRIDPALRESDFGAGEGRTRAEMAEDLPDALAAFLAAPASNPLPGGEPGAVVAERFVGALQRIAGPTPVLVVAHSTAIRLALCALLGLPLDEYRARFPELGNATVTTVRLPDDEHPLAALLRFDCPVGVPTPR